MFGKSYYLEALLQNDRPSKGFHPPDKAAQTCVQAATSD
jgi:hypothetical protein